MMLFYISERVSFKYFKVKGRYLVKDVQILHISHLRHLEFFRSLGIHSGNAQASMVQREFSISFGMVVPQIAV